MDTEIVDFTQIQKAVAFLREGKPVAFPTETVYGLGASVFCEAAISKIFHIKNRPADNPLIAHISDIQQLSLLCKKIPLQASLLCKHFWPGPLTIVLEKREAISKLIGLSTIAVRMPSHPIALSLIRNLDEPIVAPSANLSGKPSPTCAKDVFEDLQGKIELILDGGPCDIGIESTVISFVGEKPLLLRPGLITKQELEEQLQSEIAFPSDSTPHHSPGMKYRHYAPKAKIKLCYNKSEMQGPFILSLQPQQGEKLLNSQTLYAHFREADRLNVETIEIECSSELMQNAALFNRIQKACEGV